MLQKKIIFPCSCGDGQLSGIVSQVVVCDYCKAEYKVVSEEVFLLLKEGKKYAPLIINIIANMDMKKYNQSSVNFFKQVLDFGINKIRDERNEQKKRK